MSESSDDIRVDRIKQVGLVTFNRPQAMNALTQSLVEAFGRVLDSFEADDAIGAVVVTGSEKAFSAGADCERLDRLDFAEAFQKNYVENWTRLARVRKPTIAAVAGYALGGGCELAVMCDFIIAAENAKFGQPEIKLGALPGAGGAQRLAKLIGRAKTMDLILTGRMMDAAEAERAGLVARVVKEKDLLTEALKAAETIAAYSRPVVMMAKEAVGRADEIGLAEGVLFERRLYHATFATADRKEGMAAFIEKRPPRFENR